MAVVDITALVEGVSSVSGDALRDPLASTIVEATSTVTGNALRDPLASATVEANSSADGHATKVHFVTATVAAKALTSGSMVKGAPVTDATSLSNMRNNLSKVYAQLSDIDLTSVANWEPIGTSATPFTGQFEGNGFKITNLTIDRSTTDDAGLFGACSFPGIITTRLIDIAIEDADVAGQDNVGILAGRVLTDRYPVTASFDLISGCSSTGVVAGRTNVGGLFGYLHNTASDVSNQMWFDDYLAVRIIDCYSTAVVTGSGNYIGGLVGLVFGLYIYQSRALGAVTGGDIVGGLTGSLYWAYAKECYASGDVAGTKTVGGLLGSMLQRAKIHKCYAEGDVTQTDTTFALPNNETWLTYGAGGLIGYCFIEFVGYCSAKGNVSGRAGIGGLIGSSYGGDYSSPHIYNSYARGNVSGTQDVGGILGFCAPGIDNRFEQVYCTGSVTGTNRGAIVGRMFRAPEWPGNSRKITYNEPAYFNSTANTASTTWGGTAKTAAQLVIASTYEWKFFDKTWIIDVEEDTFPLLLWAYDPVGISIASIMGAANQGLVLAYISDGKTYHRAWGGSSWSAAVEITELAGAETLNLFTTTDERIGAVGSIDEVLTWAITEEDGLNIEFDATLVPGSHGDVVHFGADATSKVKLFLVNPVESVSSSEYELDLTADDWGDVAFTNTVPMPSDSYVSGLRVNYHDNSSYLIWQSRGQHRILVKDETPPVVETTDVYGSITLRLDNPIAQASLEIEALPGVV